MKQKLPRYVTAFLSSAFQAFGMYNIHAVADVTEGGVLGLTLLLEQWFSIKDNVDIAFLGAGLNA